MSEHEIGTETGIVQEVSDGKAVILLERNERCHSCTLCKPSEDGMVLTVRDPLGVSPGDKVAIGRPSEAIVKATLIVFILPVIGLVAGAFLFQRLFPQWGDTALACGGVLGLILTIGGAQLYERRLSSGQKDRMLPVIEKVL